MLYKVNIFNSNLNNSLKRVKYLYGNADIILQGTCWDKINGNLLFENDINNILQKEKNRLNQRIQGNFIILLIDKKKNNLQIITDKIASIPLYYYISKNQIQLSDNINELPSSSINIKAINRYLKCGIIPPPDTIYKNIYKLEPGIYDFNFNNKLFTKKNHTFGKKYPLKKILNKMRLNIKNYANKRKLAVLVTGGLDSSFLAALTKKMKPILFFAAVEDDKTLKYNLTSIKKCKELSKHLKLPFKVIKISKKNFLKNTQKITRIMDEPIRDYDLAAVYSLFEKISKQIPSACIISGIGVNELFNLPKKYLEIYLNKKIPIEINVHKKLAKIFGLDFYTPYLTEEIISFSLNTPLALRKDKIPFKKEIIKAKSLPFKYIEQKSQHSEIPNSFLRLLKNVYKPFEITELKKYAPSEIIKTIVKKEEILLALWLKQKFLKFRKIR